MKRINYKTAEVKDLGVTDGKITLKLTVDRDFGEWKNTN